MKPPLLHLTLCPGSPDKPTNTHTYTNTHMSARNKKKRRNKKKGIKTHTRQPWRHDIDLQPQRAVMEEESRTPSAGFVRNHHHCSLRCSKFSSWKRGSSTSVPVCMQLCEYSGYCATERPLLSASAAPPPFNSFPTFCIGKCSSIHFFFSYFFAAMQEKRAAASVGSQPTGGLLEASAQWGRAEALKELTVERGEEIYESQWRGMQETTVLKKRNFPVLLVMFGLKLEF